MLFRSIILILFTLISININASKAMRYFRDITLNDGRVVKATLVGDEHMHYHRTTDGEIILYNSEGKYYYAASKEDIDSLRNIYNNLVEQQNTNQAKGMRSSVTTNKNGHLTGTRLFPCTGNPKVLVLMVEFTDVSFTFTSEDIDTLLNSKKMNKNVWINGVVAKSQGSVAEYFDFCSGGKFRPQFDIYGTFKVNNTAAYYSSRETTFVRDACKAAEDYVDFSQYDQDGDGYVDLVYIMYAGYGGNWEGNEGTIWPKTVYTSGYFCIADGMKIHRAGMSNEINFTPADIAEVFNNEKPLVGIGTFAHEFCHTMGITDFYPNNSDWVNPNNYHPDWYDNQGMEEWSLMDGGGNRQNTCLPTPLNAFERYLFGWIDDFQILDEPANITLTPLRDGGQAYKILGNNENEYWIIEAIPSDNEWYFGFKSYTGTGMTVTHINSSISRFSASTMVNGTHGNPGLTLVPADGRIIGFFNETESIEDYDASMLGDPFPGSQGVTRLTDWWSKDGTIDKPIYQIVQNNDYSVDFSFMYLRGDANGDGEVGMADVMYIVNYTLGTPAPSFKTREADTNNDGIINMTDAMYIVSYILNGKFPKE